jgi:hypothetical protein
MRGAHPAGMMNPSAGPEHQTLASGFAGHGQGKEA